MIRCGSLLRQYDYDSFAHFLLNERKISEVTDEIPIPKASELILRLVKSFPLAFDDHYFVSSGAAVESMKVYLYSRAVLLVGNLYDRFHEEESRFAFVDYSSLPVNPGNIIPAVLIHAGVLKLSNPLQARFTNKRAIREPRHNAEIRAASLVACERLCALLISSSAAAQSSQAQDKVVNSASKSPSEDDSKVEASTASIASNARAVNPRALQYYLKNSIAGTETFKDCIRHKDPDTLMY